MAFLDLSDVLCWSANQRHELDLSYEIISVAFSRVIRHPNNSRQVGLQGNDECSLVSILDFSSRRSDWRGYWLTVEVKPLCTVATAPSTASPPGYAHQPDSGGTVGVFTRRAIRKTGCCA